VLLLVLLLDCAAMDASMPQAVPALFVKGAAWLSSEEVIVEDRETNGSGGGSICYGKDTVAALLNSSFYPSPK
jgi:hypothetical protein